MLQLTRGILSIFYNIPRESHRLYPTFLIAATSINMLFGIYWWRYRSLVFFLVPIITTVRGLIGFYVSLAFFGAIFYCNYLDHNYSTIQQSIVTSRISGKALIRDISWNYTKNTYRIDCIIQQPQTDYTASVRVYVKHKPDFEIYDTILVNDLICIGPCNDDYKKYMMKESFHATAYTNQLTSTVVNKTTIPSFSKIIDTIKNRIGLKLSKQTQALFNTLFLGSKEYQIITMDNSTKTLYEHFDTWGINHFMARSGLHVSLILSSLSMFCNGIGIPFFLSPFIILFFLIMYAFFSYASISFNRAIIMSLLTLLGSILKVPIEPIHILSISALSLMIHNPFCVFFLDFQLTFLLTAGLCILSLIKT